MNENSDREFVNSLAKGLNLLMCFTKHHYSLSLSEVARANNMNLPTARRYLHTYTKMGFMVKDNATKTFQLTPKVLRLGAWVLEATGLKQRLMPYMTSIRNDYDVTTYCAVLEGRQVVTLDRIRSTDVVNLDLRAGSRLPLHATSLGKAIVAFMELKEQQKIAGQLNFKKHTPKTITDKDLFLAELQKTRQRGYAVADQELTIGLKTLATPIFDREGRVEAAFGVSYPFSRAQEPEFENTLINCLFDITRKTRV